MTNRENVLSLFRRTGVERAPVDFQLCPHLESVYRERTGSAIPYWEYFDFPMRFLPGLPCSRADDAAFAAWYPEPLRPGTGFDLFGVAHEPGSAAAMHMTRMRHPLAGVDSLDRMREFPFPSFDFGGIPDLRLAADALHAAGCASMFGLTCTIWETAWYLRSMEDLMVDMIQEDPKAEFLLDRVTDLACLRADAAAEAGADLLFLGDDVGMQRTLLMSRELYRTWLLPRLTRVIAAARAKKPDILVMYHSCGFVEPLVGDFLEAGIDILDPVQPECMDVAALHAAYGDRLSFHGTLGTQTTMPFGTPDDVRRTVRRSLDLAGAAGGMFCAPTHMLEPEVPWENVLAYVEACRDWRP